MGEKFSIIMVDDDITNLIVARNNLVGMYDILTAPSGNKLFQLLEKVTPDLILLDVEMPGMNGYDVIKILKDSIKTAHIPVIFLTGKIDPESEITGLNLGAVDYVTKPFSRELLVKRIDLHLLIETQKKQLMRYNLNLEGEVEKKTKTVVELQNAILKTVAELVEFRDNVTGGHIERTQHYLSLLVNYSLRHGVYSDELLTWDINLFIMSSQLHDVGKISIRDEILMKPGKLTEEEFEMMKKHTIYGAEIIQKMKDSTSENAFLQYAEVLAGSHHEKWDGAGYPLGLKGLEIPLMGRLMAIADVYDALTNNRPYKKAFTHEEAVDIIRLGLGTHFDPLLDEVFLKHEKDFKVTNPGTPNMHINAGSDYKQNLSSAFNMITNVINTRNGAEREEVERIRRYLRILIDAVLKDNKYAEEVSAWDIELFLMSAQLHDVGKIAVADSILCKAEKLTDEEYENVKDHARYGVEIIKQLKSSVDNEMLLYHAETLAGNHHEKWDGTGYPLGLKGGEIPLQGRLMAIVDVYDALTTDRSHREKLPHADAVVIIRNGSGTHFDPGLVAIFLDCEKEFERVWAA